MAGEGNGIAGDHTTADELRLTVAARAAEAKKLTTPSAEGGAGMSQRQAAKVLGVSPATINSDVQELNEKRSGTEHPSKSESIRMRNDEVKARN